jgi:hypothetical protein
MLAKTRSWTVAAAALLGLLGTGAAISLAGSSVPAPAVATATTPEAIATAPAAAPSASPLAAQLGDRFSVLRGGAGQAPANIPAELLEGLVRTYGAAPEHAHAVSREGATVTVLPAATGACVTDGSVATCPPAETIAAGDLLAVTLCAPDLDAGRLRVFGLVPDGVQQVTVDGPDAEAAIVEVVDNVYVADVADTARRVSWTDGTVAHQNDLPLPPGAAHAACMS